VFICTFIGAAAQILMKLGANRLSALQPHPVELVLAIATNLHLVAGISLYGVFTFLLVLALRDGELSLLYPVIALNYVWVTVLSLLLFRETMNPFKALGIFAIMLGVMVIGRGARR
jgi:drug/metabolite transporter (DMT)-like permease